MTATASCFVCAMPEGRDVSGWWVACTIGWAFFIVPYLPDGRYGLDDRKVCGEACAHKLLAEHLREVQAEQTQKLN